MQLGNNSESPFLHLYYWNNGTPFYRVVIRMKWNIFIIVGIGIGEILTISIILSLEDDFKLLIHLLGGIQLPGEKLDSPKSPHSV